MLDRVGDEVARATSIVRYAPHSRFASHTHGGGEEFLVLDGIFQDERGDYPAGTYVRNPPTSSYTPGSQPSCTIFVKLWQFGRTPVRIDTSGFSFAPAPDFAGVEFALLYEDAWELVLLERWAPGINISVPLPGGIELLVLGSRFIEGGEEFTRLSWLRLPAGAMYKPLRDQTAAKSGSSQATSCMSHGGQPLPDISTEFRWRSNQVSYEAVRFSRRYGSLRRGDAASEGCLQIPVPVRAPGSVASDRVLAGAGPRQWSSSASGGRRAGWIQLKVP